MKTRVCLFAALLGMVFGPPPTRLLWGSDGEGRVPPVTDGSQAPQPKGPPPLVVDKSAPLLLEEPSATDKAAPLTDAARKADNAACFVCHANFQGESLAQKHAQARVGCVDCHGKSFAHRNDENNTTPPEKMYPAEDIDRACQECHPTHDVPPARVLTLGIERGLSQKDTKAIVCTACHGDHRLTQRTVRWDKRTGKLLPRAQ
jgi:hypothetical protein